MQKSAELAIIKNAKADIHKLLGEAIEHQRKAEAARTDVEEGQQLAVWEAYQCGLALNKLKPIFPHGSWMPWLELNFCKKRDVEYQTAALYMKIANDNPNVRRVGDLKFDTIRKFRLRFVPEKEKPEQPGNVKFPRFMHHLKIVNEIERWVQRRKVGHVEKNPVEERRNFRELVLWFIEELFADCVTRLPDGRRVLLLDQMSEAGVPIRSMDGGTPG